MTEMKIRDEECNYKIIQYLEQLDQVDGYLYF